MSQAHDVTKMVGVYKKLFILLVSVTALGIVLTVVHMPVALTILISLSIILIKGKIVFDAFKEFLVGKNVLIILFGLTIIFFIAIVTLPLLNHENTIVGTEDLSKAIQAEQPVKGAHHGD